jgi:hypothetical protein
LREAKDFQSFSVSAARYSKLHQVVSGVGSATCSRPSVDLGFRIFVSTAWIIIGAALAFIQTAIAEPYLAHTDLEFRLGAGQLNGTSIVTDNDEGLSQTIKMTAQIFADRLFPVTTIGDGAFEIGPYAKGALLDGVSVPQIAGGVILGYRLRNYEILVNVGLAYATERIGETTSQLGQTKNTYDLGLTLRYDINQYFISTGYQHNSNGSAVGLDFIRGKGQNPGYDQLFAGVGIRF